MKKVLLVSALLTLIAALPAAADVVMYDLSTVGATATVNGALFHQGSVQPAGTGVIQPFLRIQATGNEDGYNTDQFPHPPLDDHSSHTWTHSILLSQVPIFNINGTNYYQFLLDINEGNGTGEDTLLSLDYIQLYTGNVPSPVCCPPFGASPPANPNFGTLWWNLDGGGNDNYLLLRANLSHGSGSSDMYMFVPVNAFAGNTNPYLYLYSGFGYTTPFTSNGGFEEWAVGQSPTQQTVPEPASLALLGTGLISAGGFIRRKLGK